MSIEAIDNRKQSQTVSVRKTGATCPGSVRGFTLIELMISIALVLILILGVNQVFTYTTQAVGAGEAINAAIRSSRAAQSQMTDDFSGIVANGSGPSDAASIIISSRAYYAFRNAKDQASQGTTASNNSNSAGLPTSAFTDINGDGQFGDTTVNGEIVWPSTYNFRNHRLDTLSFFSRGLFNRQTGTGGSQGTFVDSLATQEAWIWYGHLQLPDNGGNLMVIDYPNVANSFTKSTFPCMGPSPANPNNYFGSQLVLGRVAMLLSLTTTDRQGLQQWYSPGLFLGSQITTTGNSPQSPEYTGGYYLPDSRVDLAATSIYKYQQLIAGLVSGTDWWDPMMSGNQAYASVAQFTRFKCNPFVSKPMTSQGMAQASPYFLGGCSQFIVEFAGDFLSQDNSTSDFARDSSHPKYSGLNHAMYGDVTGPGPDGQIDYVLIGSGQSQRKQIIWYGLPRSTSGNTVITGSNGDVVPLRDYFQNMYYGADGATWNAGTAYTATSPNTFPNSNAGFPTFEKGGPNYQLPAVGYGSGKMTQAEAQNGYTCAFGPSDPHPKLIRVTLTLEDPTGRLPDGQTYQYVFSVP